MLATLKVSSLAYKCVFYRPEINAKGGAQGTEFWRSLNVIMFAPGVMVIKMSKMAYFLYFLLIFSCI